MIGEGERRRWFDFGPDEKPTSYDHSLHLDVQPTLYRVTHLDLSWVDFDLGVPLQGFRAKEGLESFFSGLF